MGAAVLHSHENKDNFKLSTDNMSSGSWRLKGGRSMVGYRDFKCEYIYNFSSHIKMSIADSKLCMA